MKGVSVSNQNTDTDSVVFLKNTSAQSRKTNEKGDGEGTYEQKLTEWISF